MRTVTKIVIYYSDGTYEEFNKNYVMPPMPSPNPWPIYNNNSCKVCGMKFDGPMGYVCGRTDCPSGVTCSNAV